MNYYFFSLHLFCLIPLTFPCKKSQMPSLDLSKQSLALLISIILTQSSLLFGFLKRGKKEERRGRKKEERERHLPSSFILLFVLIKLKEEFSSFFHVVFGYILNKEERDLWAPRWDYHLSLPEIQNVAFAACCRRCCWLLQLKHHHHPEITSKERMIFNNKHP